MINRNGKLKVNLTLFSTVREIISQKELKSCARYFYMIKSATTDADGVFDKVILQVKAIPYWLAVAQMALTVNIHIWTI